MTRLIDHERIDAFVDGELELSAQLEMEQRMEDDPALRGQVEQLRELGTAIRRDADYHAAPDALRQRFASMSARSGQPPAKADRPLADTLGRWLGWRPLTASLAFAAVATIGVHLAWVRVVAEQRLEDDVVASHVRSTLGQHLVDIASSDHHTVKPFLSAKLGFSPPVGELQLPGSVFLGGRVDYLDGRPVAALVYRQGEHVVNSFIWPVGTADGGPAFSQERGFRTAHWTHAGMAHWVISDVNGEEFKAVVRAVQQNDESR
jgi:anti-sigma factor RsiW